MRTDAPRALVMLVAHRRGMFLLGCALHFLLFQTARTTFFANIRLAWLGRRLGFYQSKNGFKCHLWPNGQFEKHLDLHFFRTVH